MLTLLNFNNCTNCLNILVRLALLNFVNLFFKNVLIKILINCYRKIIINTRLILNYIIKTYNKLLYCDEN